MTVDSSPIPLALADFQASAGAVLEFLGAHIPLGLWMVTRLEGDDWIVLSAEDHGYSVKPGTLFRWSDSFCSRMVDGLGPRIAPRSDEVPAYAAAPIGQQVPIQAYVGVPIIRNDASLFGTLCGIDPAPQDDAIAEQQPLIELFAGLLGTILATESRMDDERRRAERAEAESKMDALTAIGNRRAWESILEAEEARCARYGDPAWVIAIDLNHLKAMNDLHGHAAGDEMIRKAAQAIADAVPPPSFAARVGGDEFAVIAVDSDAEAASDLVGWIERSLTASEIDASIGSAPRHPSEGLDQAWRTADAAMYEAKRASRS